MEVKPLGLGWFEVQGRVKYLVKVSESGRDWCECPDFSFRKRVCKHLKACMSFGVRI